MAVAPLDVKRKFCGGGGGGVKLRPQRRCEAFLIMGCAIQEAVIMSASISVSVVEFIAGRFCAKPEASCNSGATPASRA